MRYDAVSRGRGCDRGRRSRSLTRFLWRVIFVAALFEQKFDAFVRHAPAHTSILTLAHVGLCVPIRQAIVVPPVAAGADLIRAALAVGPRRARSSLGCGRCRALAWLFRRLGVLAGKGDKQQRRVDQQPATHDTPLLFAAPSFLKPWRDKQASINGPAATCAAGLLWRRTGV